MENEENEKIKKYKSITWICAVLALVFWFSAFGWLRIILTFVVVPVIAIFIITNLNVIKNISKSKALERVIKISFFLFPMCFIIPDFGDRTEDTNMLFGMIKDRNMINNCFNIIRYVIMAELICFVLKIVFNILAKKKKNVTEDNK